MVEKEIERRLHKSIKDLKHGALCLKFESPGFVGVPDRIILLPGAKVIFAETKAPHKKERVRQEYVQGLFRALGFEVYSAVDSVDYVQQITDRCKEILRDEGIYTT